MKHVRVADGALVAAASADDATFSLTEEACDDVRAVTVDSVDAAVAEIAGRNAAEVVNDQAWIENDFIPTVAKRGAAIIEARGLSSAASAANAAIDHVRDWVLGSNGKWVTMGVPSDGSYGIPEGVMFGFPVTTENGEYKIVQGLEIDDFSRAKIDASVAELVEEKDAVTELGLI